MCRKFFAVFVAGGSGSRMGSAVPKQFLPLCSIPILQRSIETFLEACPDSKVITVLPKEHFDTWQKLCCRYALNCPQILVEGGITRFHSVRAALEKVPDGCIVSVHDGVRPLVSTQLIKKMVGMMEDHDALIPVIPVIDSLKNLDGSLPEPDRSRIVAVQTPQMFRSELLKDAYKQAYRERFTDDASVAVRAGVNVDYTDGERFNIKITTPEDMKLAELLMQSPISF